VALIRYCSSSVKSLSKIVEVKGGNRYRIIDFTLQIYSLIDFVSASIYIDVADCTLAMNLCYRRYSRLSSFFRVYIRAYIHIYRYIYVCACKHHFAFKNLTSRFSFVYKQFYCEFMDLNGYHAICELASLQMQYDIYP